MMQDLGTNEQPYQLQIVTIATTMFYSFMLVLAGCVVLITLKLPIVAYSCFVISGIAMLLCVMFIVCVRRHHQDKKVYNRQDPPPTYRDSWGHVYYSKLATDLTDQAKDIAVPIPSPPSTLAPSFYPSSILTAPSGRSSTHTTSPRPLSTPTTPSCPSSTLSILPFPFANPSTLPCPTSTLTTPTTTPLQYPLPYSLRKTGRCPPPPQVDTGGHDTPSPPSSSITRRHDTTSSPCTPVTKRHLKPLPPYPPTIMSTDWTEDPPPPSYQDVLKTLGVASLSMIKKDLSLDV
ncbi:proline-rich receptor-like protein kinase PERK2 [Homarus americanus]|uniref:proline-rich receptor-like protein kinase PERK2 n=1 Tax=Homarus americanus TaxID=6706 RepID=UPI001C45FA58|nr:proline-rich receptor-like protein kinase PERK2 [Homarus americanus]